MIWLPTEYTGEKLVMGSWKTMAISLPRIAADLRALGVQGREVHRPGVPVEHHAPARDDAVPGHDAEDRLRGHALAAAGLPDDAQDAPSLHVEGDPVHGPERALARDEVGLEVLDLQEHVALRRRSCADRSWPPPRPGRTGPRRRGGRRPRS